MKFQLITFTLAVFLFTACSESGNSTDNVGEDALKDATALVTELKQTLSIDDEIAAQAWGNVPVIAVRGEDPASDYRSSVGAIVEAVSSFEDELWIVYEGEMEREAHEKRPDFITGKRILARFDGHTGQELN